MCTWHGLYSQHSEAEAGGSLPWGYTVKENKSVWGDRGKRQRCGGRRGGERGREKGRTCWLRGSWQSCARARGCSQPPHCSGAEAGELQLQPTLCLSPHSTEAPECLTLTALLGTISNPACPPKRGSLRNGHLCVPVLKSTVTAGPDFSPGSSSPAHTSFPFPLRS